jgi:hypothetical protein
VDPVLGSLVYQLPEGVTLAYDLCLGCTIARWKGIIKEIHFGTSVASVASHFHALSVAIVTSHPVSVTTALEYLLSVMA